MLELGCALDVKALHQATTQSLDHASDPPSRQVVLELEDVTRDSGRVDADELLSGADQNRIAQRPTDSVKGIPERLTTVGLIPLRPEKPDE
jgi:hypothetical protein